MKKIVLVLYSFFVPLLVLPVSGNIFLSVSDLMIPVGIIMVIYRLGIKSKLDKISFLMIVFLLFVLTSIHRIPTLSFQLNSFIKWVRLLGIILPFYYAQLLGFEEDDLVKSIRLFFSGGLVAIILGIALFKLGIQVGANQQSLIVGDNLRIYRAGGLVGNSGVFAHLVVVWASIALFFYSKIFTKKIHLVWIIMVLLYALIISSSRSGLLYIVVSLVVFLFNTILFENNTKRKVKMLLNIIIFIVLFIFVLNFLFNKFDLRKNLFLIKSMSRFFIWEADDLNKASSTRLSAWPMQLRMAFNNLFFGVGYKYGYIYSGRYVDNTFLSTLLETGVISFVLYVSMVTALVKKFYKGIKINKQISLASIAILAGNLVFSLTADILTFWYTTTYLSFFFGLVVVSLNKSVCSD